ncbi:MAG: hypothetical protein Q8Q09_27960 [Deltaproteobacteria bacterium]|nr:hypothetical protein [Deltaproteobacteria bacterium]
MTYRSLTHALLLGLCLVPMVHCTSVPLREDAGDASTDQAITAMDTAAIDAAQPSLDAEDRVSPVDVSSDPATSPDVSTADTGGTCPAGLLSCAGRCVDPNNSAEHCGMCGQRCPTGTNGTPRCAAGACSLACASGFADCDLFAGNGCEVSTASNANHCGACGRNCTLPNATAACASAQCRVGTCNAGFADCDTSATNGCETRLDSASNCGGCGVQCSGATPVCDSAARRCVSGCTAPALRCGGSCVDTTTSTAHCGGCNMACPSPANSIASCNAGRCALTCMPGFANCDGVDTNGCEVDLNASSTDCGMCGNACPSRISATNTCVRGVCTLQCRPGFANCDGNDTNGCEVSTANNPSNCGTCGTVCSGSICAAGACQPCGRPTIACNNVCVSLQTDQSNCGACGYRCPRSTGISRCESGNCYEGTVCRPQLADCDRSALNGYEVNTDTSRLHCGACNNACRLGDNCCNGRCQSTACTPCSLM